MLKKKRFISIDEYNIDINNWNGVFQILAVNLVTPFATMFAKRLNASDLEIALLNSLPAIVSIGAIIPGAIYIQKCRDKKNATARFFITARIFYLLFALVPLLARQYRASVFILLYGLMNLPGSIALSSWQSYIAGLFPPSMRAGVLASRNKISTLVGIITTLAAGWALYNLPGSDEQRVLIYQIFFGAAFIFSIMEIYLFYRHKEPGEDDQTINSVQAIVSKPTTKVSPIIKGMKSNRRFIYFCLAAIVFHFAWYAGWPLFPLYEIDILHSNEVWASLFSSINGAAAAIAYPYWSRFVSRKGNALPLSIAVFSMAVVPLTYPMANSLYAILFISIAGGVALSGITLIVLNSLYEVSPENGRTIYIAFFNTMLNVVLAIAPFAGVALKDYFNIYNAFTIVGTLRLLSGVVFYIRYRSEKR